VCSLICGLKVHGKCQGIAQTIRLGIAPSFLAPLFFVLPGGFQPKRTPMGATGEDLTEPCKFDQLVP